MPLPMNYNIRVVAGDAYSLTADHVENGEVVDITDEVVTMKVYSAETLLFTLTEGDGLTVTGALGRVVIDLTAAQTEELKGKVDRAYILRLDTSETTILVGRIDVYDYAPDAAE